MLNSSRDVQLPRVAGIVDSWLYLQKHNQYTRHEKNISAFSNTANVSRKTVGSSQEYLVHFSSRASFDQFSDL